VKQGVAIQVGFGRNGTAVGIHDRAGTPTHARPWGLSSVEQNLLDLRLVRPLAPDILKNLAHFLEVDPVLSQETQARLALLRMADSGWQISWASEGEILDFGLTEAVSVRRMSMTFEDVGAFLSNVRLRAMA
jgi:hypothetical protein